MGLLLAGSFILFMVLGVPVGLAIGAAGLLVVLLSGFPLAMIPQNMFSGNESLPWWRFPFRSCRGHSGQGASPNGSSLSQKRLGVSRRPVHRLHRGLHVHRGHFRSGPPPRRQWASPSSAAQEKRVRCRFLRGSHRSLGDHRRGHSSERSHGALRRDRRYFCSQALYGRLCPRIPHGTRSYRVFHVRRSEAWLPRSRSHHRKAEMETLSRSVLGAHDSRDHPQGIFPAFYPSRLPPWQWIIHSAFFVLVHGLQYSELVVGRVTSSLIMFIIPPEIFGWGLTLKSQGSRRFPRLPGQYDPHLPHDHGIISRRNVHETASALII